MTLFAGLHNVPDRALFTDFLQIVIQIFVIPENMSKRSAFGRLIRLLIKIDFLKNQRLNGMRYALLGVLFSLKS